MNVWEDVIICMLGWLGWCCIKKSLKIHYIVFIINGNDRALFIIFPFVMSSVIWGCCGSVKGIMQWYCSIWFCSKIPSFLIFMIRTQENDMQLPFFNKFIKSIETFFWIHCAKQTSVKKFLCSLYGWRDISTEGKMSPKIVAECLFRSQLLP